MLNGHTSHQVGLDADIWLTPMPDRTLTPQEREDMNAVSMLKDPFTVDPDVFTLMQVKLIKRAASYPQVARIFVHPAIKKALCQMAPKSARTAPGSARCGRGGTTIIISMCAWPARRGWRAARIRRRCPATTAAVRN